MLGHNSRFLIRSLVVLSDSKIFTITIVASAAIPIVNTIPIVNEGVHLLQKYYNSAINIVMHMLLLHQKALKVNKSAYV